MIRTRDCRYIPSTWKQPRAPALRRRHDTAIRFPPTEIPRLMILVLDNYDSFTWNLVQMLEALGGETEVVRNDERTVQEIERQAPSASSFLPDPARRGKRASAPSWCG